MRTEVRSVTEVAVGVLQDPETGRVLLGSRPEGKPYAGWWELPGGKLELGESVHEALVRELKEELDLTVLDSMPWFVMEKSYPHAYVRLHFRRSWTFSGEAMGLEGQEFCWANPVRADSLQLKLLPMVSLVLRRLMLPAILAFGETPAALEKAADFVRSTADAAVWVRTATERQTAENAGATVFYWPEAVIMGAAPKDFMAETTVLFGLGASMESVAGHANRLPVYVPWTDGVGRETILRSGAHGVYRRFF